MKTLLKIGPLSSKEIAELQGVGYQILTAEEVVELDNIDAIYGWEDKIGRQILERPNNRLRWVQNIGAGVNNLPLALLKEHNVEVTNASGDKAIPIAQTVLAALLFRARGLDFYAKQQTWQPNTDLSLLSEFPVMIFGTGAIGRQIAKYLEAFDVPVVGVNRTGHEAEGFSDCIALEDSITYLHAYLPAAVVSTLPGTAETEKFFDAEFFGNSSLSTFINVGRGTTVDEEALMSALKDEFKLASAVLEVTEQEPIPADSPLWTCPNLTLTQHTAWAEQGYPQRGGRIYEIIRENFVNFIADEPLTVNLVDLERGY